MNSNKLTTTLLYISAAIFLFGTGYKMGEFKSVNRPSFPLLSAFNSSTKTKAQKDIDFSLFWDTWDKLEQKYVDKKKLNSKKMYYGAIKGMTASLEDPYTFFLTPEENKQTKEDLGGKFEGIGAQLGLKDNRVVIVAPLKESPAEKAGLKTGDVIVKVNGEAIKNWTLVQTVSKIRGPKGSTVKLGIQRETGTLDVEITRDEIRVPTIELSYESQVAILKLNQFGENTDREWTKAVTDIAAKWKSGSIKGMVLDLRDNPGGYLEAAVYLASEFLPQQKLVVKQESTNPSQTREYMVDRPGELLDIPLVVLINQGSASASEILGGALRDYKRARLIGEKSFGKGSVQEAIDLKDDAGLHVTVAKWILPKGDWINGKGIEPDIKIERKVTEATESADLTQSDTQLERAMTEVVK